jgi:hypothetical protein
MKVQIGDTVCSNDFGSGEVVAMTKQWCIYRQGSDEFALPWGEIYIEAESGSVCSSVEQFNLDS